MDWTVILPGGAGGLLPDVLRLVKGRHGPAPSYLKSGHFWLSLGGLVVLGAVAARFGGAQSGQEALAYGFGAPEILSKLFSKEAPPQAPPAGAPPAGGAARTLKPGLQVAGLRECWAGWPAPPAAGPEAHGGRTGRPAGARIVRAPFARVPCGLRHRIPWSPSA